MKISFEDLDKLNVYRCQCCKPTGKFLFEMPADGLCPAHGYPLHYIGPLPVIYRSLGMPKNESKLL
jgi:hypothetical protein